jgi:hypothetical protein
MDADGDKGGKEATKESQKEKEEKTAECVRPLSAESKMGTKRPADGGGGGGGGGWRKKWPAAEQPGEWPLASHKWMTTDGSSP